jgi:NADH-quinone oxidoreductase subunit C
MEATDLVRRLEEAVPDATFELSASADGQPTVFVSAPDLPRVALALRERRDLRFTLLIEVTAVDYSPREPRFELIYLLVSMEHRTRLRLKVRLPGTGPEVATVSGIWPAANWLEREVWDLFGIVFQGHPDPRRLLMPEDWEGYPLRKDYPVQINMPPRTSEPLQVSEEQFRENVERDRLARRS